ncbi:hypothetical protein [Flavobacterium tegetincola]|uniref:hypothetical protein n=1 Tax=Flavobacterium tegetincola TaxID=150172 RepID=UPI0003FFD2A6|nr:hypothetical protein [Flavobacterium tegetincola]
MNCDTKDDTFEEESRLKSPIEYVTLSDFSSNITTSDISEKLKLNFDINKNNNQLAQSKGVTNDDLTIITDEIIKITKNDTIYYTFKTFTPLAKNNEFYNLIVYVNRQHEIFNLELLRYTPEIDWLSDIKKPYRGTVAKIEHEISMSTLIANRSFNGLGNCLQSVSTKWNCEQDNEHSGPGKGRTCTYWDLIVTLNYGPCPDENEEEVEVIVDVPSPGGGGGATPDGTPTVPTPPCQEVVGGQTIGITDGSGGCLDAQLSLTAIQLKNALETNPYLLLDIPCDQIPKWQEIAQYEVPQVVKDKINTIDSQTGWFSSAAIQTLNDSNNGAAVNMDFFPVTISQMPKKPNGQVFTQKELFEYIRTNINDFFDDLTFTPIVDSNYNIDDTALWQSNNPLKAILQINIFPNMGSVVCSNFNSNTGEWYFSTITDPWSYSHPVSGNRSFGYFTDNLGRMVIYTRGVDRITHGSSMLSLPGVIAEAIQQEIAFNSADNKWINFQNKIKDFVNSGQAASNNGQAVANIPKKFRPNWDKVKNVLNGSQPISSLGCN